MVLISEMDARVEKIKADVAELVQTYGWSQARVARAAGLNAPHLSNILADKGNPTDTTIQRLQLAVGQALREARKEPSSTERLPEVLVWFRGLTSSGRELVLRALSEAHKELTAVEHRLKVAATKGLLASQRGQKGAS